MAGAGKSTPGTTGGRAAGVAHLDTDRLIEATFGMPLRPCWTPGLDEFLRIEEDVVSRLWLRLA
jgi:shikimate kinase